MRGTGCGRTELDQEVDPIVEMTGEELGCTVECPPRADELLDVELKDVMHSLPHLEPHCAASVDDGKGEPPRIIDQDLVRADLNQQRRQ